jgi:hypothetical protein
VPRGQEDGEDDIVTARLAAGFAGAIGIAAAFMYHASGLTLSHYDARGHLVVARRIVDSITPGWQQVGAVWLPLPHLLNALPIQFDVFYRTGFSAVAISVAAFAVATAAIAWIVRECTQSAWAAAAAVAVFALNPNVLYLQATPMTEPLLMALTTAGVALLIGGAPARLTGMVLALACLTRYEAWPITAAALAIGMWKEWRGGASIAEAARAMAAIAAYPAVAIAGFAIFSRVVVGAWFVSGDFFVPENKSLHDAGMSIREIAWGVRALSSEALVWAGALGLAAGVVSGLVVRDRARWAVTAALAASAAVPLAAFYDGHPFRIRYMVPLLAAQAVGVGLTAGAVRRASVAASIAAIALVAVTLRPFDAHAPMVVEAQWDRPNVPVRARVTECLGQPRPGEKIMASMGSLGHYMQETSASGFAIRDFLHEGNGDIWLAALQRPRPFADWVLIEEKAEGGDMLAHLAREHPTFLDGYSRVCEGAGLALYRRTN